MHEGLPKEIVGSVSRTGEEALRAEKGPSSTSLLPSQSSSLNRQGNATMKKLAMLALALASVPITAFAQSTHSQAPPYCFDLSRIVDLAVTKERFASIAGRPRPGDFRDASLILAGWKDCSLYGAATYTCDSAEMDTAEAGPRPPSGPRQATSFCTPPRDRSRSRSARIKPTASDTSSASRFLCVETRCLQWWHRARLLKC